VSQLQALREIHTETAPFNELATRINGLPVEPRCRVCRNDALRRKVNDLLSGGASYAMVLRTLEQDNAKLDTRDRVTIDSIRHHTRRHFPVQNVARATYRAILERRAKENGVDFVKGVATAITPMSFYETVMVKGYEALVDPDTKVDVDTGMKAAGRLQALIDSRAGKTSMAEILFKMDRIINAIHDTVPQELWEVILRKIDGPVAADSPADEFEDAEDEYDPVESGQADQDRSTRCAGTRQFHRRGQEEVAITEKVQHESAHRPIRTFTPRTKTDDDDSF
jgi:hypothetical protein